MFLKWLDDSPATAADDDCHLSSLCIIALKVGSWTCFGFIKDILRLIQEAQRAMWTKRKTEKVPFSTQMYIYVCH